MERVSMIVVLACAVGARAANDGPETLLLKDFRPQSIYNIPRTDVAKARHPAIDMHAHPYARTPEQVDQWVRVMNEHGIAKAIILTGTCGEQFDELHELYSKYPNRFELWCGLDYTGYDQPGFGPAAVEELRRCHKVGARGVGELGDKGKGLFYSRPTKGWGMHLDDPRMDPLLEACAALKMPVNIHVADPYWMYQPMDAKNDGLMNAYTWRLDNQPDIVGHAGMVEILERAVKRHPKTTFVACHFANCTHDLNRLGELFDRYPNLYADISARYAETAAIPRFAAQFYERYQDRLVYGTDMRFGRDVYRLTFRILESADEHFYAWSHSSYHWPLYGLSLSDRVLEKVYRTNALKILQKRAHGPNASGLEVAEVPQVRPLLAVAATREPDDALREVSKDLDMTELTRGIILLSLAFALRRPQDAALLVEFRGDVDSYGAETRTRVSERQRKLAILRVFLQALEEPGSPDPLYLSKVCEPGAITGKGFGALDSTHDLFDLTAVFLCEFHRAAHAQRIDALTV